MSVCLSVSLSIYAFVCVSVRLVCVCMLSVGLYVFVCVCVSVCLSVYRYICLSICLYIGVSVCVYLVASNVYVCPPHLYFSYNPFSSLLIFSLSTGTWFGEIALRGTTVRTSTAKAVSSCMMLQLSAPQYKRLAQEFPSVGKVSLRIQIEF